MAFEIAADLQPIHQPVRLRIMTLLFRERDVGFAQARDALGLSDGNLGSHAKVLETNGLIRSRRTLHDGAFQVRYVITDRGSHAFRRYLAALEAFLAAVDDVR